VLNAYASKIVRLFISFVIILFFNNSIHASSISNSNSVQWRDFTEAAFAEAKRDGKLLILDLEAVWCHWCHVMEEKTYSNPAVIKILNEHYIALKVDQNNRPDLARRYQDFGWPATIFFNAEGTELVKRAGYIPPEAMARLLQAVVDDPSPEKGAPIQQKKTFASSALLVSSIKKQLEKSHLDAYDSEFGSLKINQKFLERDSVEYDLFLARGGDKQAEKRAKQTLDAAMALIDPVWGGVYQYSTGGRWDYPHFEKIMPSQSGYLRIYAMAYRQFKEEKYLQAAIKIADYLENFLMSKSGVFYTSQDADLVQGVHSREYFELGDKARRAQGIPKIDKHQYAQENGWASTAMVNLYQATGRQHYLELAQASVGWVEKNRAMGNGGYRHDSIDKGGPYLGDNIAMAEANLALYQATGNRENLARTRKTMAYIDKTFRYAGEKGAGYAVSYAPASAIIKPQPHIDENIAVSRLAIRVYHLTGEENYKKIAERGMRYLATEDIATSRLTEAGILLLAFELATDPTHITIVGAKQDKSSKALYKQALTYPGSYRRIEWWDKSEGPMPNPDVKYPALPKAAAFACANQRCSLPVFNKADIHPMVDALNSQN